MDKQYQKRQFEIPYLSDDELRALIDEIEQTSGEYVQAPGSIEEQVFAKTAPEKSAKAVPERLPDGEHRETARPRPVLLEDRIRRKKRELLRYTLRVALSAAASIAILLAFPLVQQTNVTVPQGRESQTEERWQEEYEKEKQGKEKRDARRREEFENRGERDDTSMWDGLENVMSIMRRITK